MSSFLRYAGAAALLLSFGLFVQALPVLIDVKVPVPIGTDVVSKVFANLVINGEIEAKLKAIAAINTLVELKALIAVIVTLFKGCADELLKIGAGVVVDVDAQASIVACVAAIITLLVKVFAQVSLKLGITVCAAVFAEVDVCLRALLVNLNICIDGIVTLVVKALVSVTVAVLVGLKLQVCADILAKAGLAL
ncbi:hypothetical protein OPQ81_003847 [Rhizoctonia solani]|nr:hypothetical protein OPQ81_003845 [Rhizoctonia solani]KAJ1308126.1 hypothetical protein OPQ81_003847 [Rhizoctonia solani]